MVASDLHQTLCNRAVLWLVNSVGCQVAGRDLGAETNAEICDAVGFINGYCIVVEVKVSRADFLNDRKKRHRQEAKEGMGSYRFYMTPPGLLAPSEIPEGWGLVESNGASCRVVHGPKANQIRPWYSGMWEGIPPIPFKETHIRAEMCLLVGMVRRVHQPYIYKTATGKIVTKGMLPHLHEQPAPREQFKALINQGEGTHHDEPTTTA